MQVLEALRSAQGGEGTANIARTFGITPQQAEAALVALVPEVSRVIERNTLSRGGVADVLAALGDPRHHSALNDPSALNSPSTQAAGVELLQQMLGGKDKSRALAARAAASSGLGETLIKQLLPYVLPMIIAAIAKSGTGALGDILSKVPGMSKVPGLPGEATTSPAPTSSRTSPRDKPRPGHPLPLPGEHTPLGGNNPYSDLSDSIRNGGGAANGLPALIRSILGGLLGFQSRGVISWILRFVVMRFGWPILRTILGSLFGSRR